MSRCEPILAEVVCRKTAPVKILKSCDLNKILLGPVVCGTAWSVPQVFCNSDPNEPIVSRIAGPMIDDPMVDRKELNSR